MKWCPGYTSTGDSGNDYLQVKHELQGGDKNFSPGKSQCRDCYRAYAQDWRARRNVGATGSKKSRGSSSRAPKQTIQLPDFRAPALEAAADKNGEESDEGEVVSEATHDFVPMPELIEAWGAVTNDAAKGGHPFNLLFLGPSGSGKTEAALYLADLVGLPFTKVDAAAMTDPESWFGTREVVVEDGAPKTVYRPSAFVLAIEEPGVLLIDELNRVRDEHRNVLLPLLDGTHQVTNPLTGDAVVKDPRCFIIGTGNRGVQFTGTYAVDPALMTRMLTIPFEYAPAPAEIKIAMDASKCDEAIATLFVRFANESRERSKSDPDFQPISTREVIAACKLVSSGATRDLAADIAIINQASPEGGAQSVQAGLQLVWNGVRAGDEAVKALCGDQNQFHMNTTGDPLQCDKPLDHHNSGDEVHENTTLKPGVTW